MQTSIFKGQTPRNERIASILTKWLGKSPYQGAQTTIYVATETLDKSSLNGKFIKDNRKHNMDWMMTGDIVDRFWDHLNTKVKINE